MWNVSMKLESIILQWAVGKTAHHTSYLSFFSCPQQLNRWPCHWLTDSVTDWLTVLLLLKLQSDPRDLWPLRHLIRVTRKHDVTNILTPPSPPPSSRPLARTALRVRTVNLRDFGGSDEGLANLAEQFHENNYRRRWVSLSRSVDSDCSSSCSSAASLSPSGSVSDHSDCPDLGSEGGWETDSDVG